MVSIIIPVFNEEKRLSENLQNVDTYLKSLRENYELLIINDGSSDSTAKLLKEYEKKFKLKVINHKKNLGKGAAIKTGVNNSLGDVIIFTDIDLSVPIEFVKKFTDTLNKETDIIIGSRENRKSKVEVKQFFLREIAGGIFTQVTNLILWVGVTDFTCGFKLFRKEAALKIFNKQLINRWAFDAESLFLARKYGFKIKEEPVLWRHGEGSKVRFPQDVIESFVSLFKIRANDFLGKYD